MLISLVVFVSLHNLTETSLLFSAEPRWITLLMIYAIVQHYRQKIQAPGESIAEVGLGAEAKAGKQVGKLPVVRGGKKNLQRNNQR
jgi:hypothetical protein